MNAQLETAPKTRGILRPVMPPNPALEVLQLLLSVPKLAEQEDEEQVEGLLRLVRLMRALAGEDEGPREGESPEAAALRSSAQDAARILSWLVNVSGSL